MSMTGRTRPVIPALNGIYPQATEWAYLLLRVTAGLMLLPHVWPKLMMGPAAVAANMMAKRGVEPAMVAAWLAIIVELGGAIFITLGLFTRPIALLVAIEFVVIAKTHLVFGWGAGGGGAEYVILWLIVFLFILARGGGPYSLDAKLGREV
jgi:putative oxidoreductase